MRPGLAIVILWVGWAASWILAAAWQAKTAKSAGLRAELPSRLVQVAGGVLLLVRAHGYVGPLRLWSVTWVEAWVCVGVIAVGFAFSWWARIYLGPLWSGQVTTKTDHRVIDSGPYGIVRHPIYTGLLLAIYGTVAAKGTVLGLAGGLLVTIGLWMKARLEERWLRQEIGPEAYDAYRHRVPMLLPFGPTGG
jgi:protein-S-isoprenylcysteine O-methyltransferase Ste14